MKHWRDLLELSDADLARVDPLEMSLLVAKGIPALAHLDIAAYQRRADKWADQVRVRLLRDSREFYKTPQDWQNDIYMFRLGVLANHLETNLNIQYREDQRTVQKISYTNPSDLFVNGVMDTKRGTCGNMAMLHVVLGRRLGWPVSITKAWWHSMVRYDNKKVVWTVEATHTGRGGFVAEKDDYFIRRDNIPLEHVRSGSDLSFLNPRQLLGEQIGMRGRHWWDIDQDARAREDFELALKLFPQSRVYRHMIEKCDFAVTIQAKHVLVGMQY